MPRYIRIVRLLLFAIGIAIVLYAVSDHPLYGGEPGFGSTQLMLVVCGVALFACGLLPRRAAEGMLLFSIVGFAMLTLAEVTGEIALGSRYRPIYQLDEELIFKFIPDRNKTITRAPINGGVTVTHSINSDGFRGPELRSNRDVPRVVVYGDSFIHGYYSPSEETFAGQLASLLSKQAGGEVEVVNAGVSSYGPDQILLKMKRELHVLSPDLVIVSIFGGNDYGDMMRNKLFLLDDWGELQVNESWRLEESLARQWELSQKTSIIKDALVDGLKVVASIGSADDGSETFGVSDFSNPSFLVEQAEREYQSYIVERNNVIDNTHVDYYSANINFTPNSDSALYQSRLMTRVMAEIQKVARQENVPLLFVFIPHPFDVTEQYDEWTFNPKHFPNYDARRQIAIMEEAATEQGSDFVSLFDAYRAQEDANDLYFHGGDDHWNARGQRLAAELVAEFVDSRNLLSD